MDLKSNSSTEMGFDIAAQGEVRSLAVPAQAQPSFAIPLVSLGPLSNAFYIQQVDWSGRVIGLSPISPPEAMIRPLGEIAAVVTRGEPEIHAIIDMNALAHVGTQAALRSTIAGIVPDIAWPMTRLSFASFVGDTAQAVAASTAVYSAKTQKLGDTGARRWFVNAIVSRRIHLAALKSAKSKKQLAAISVLLRQMTIITTAEEIEVRAPSELLDLFEGPARKSPDWAMAGRLAAIITKNGLTTTLAPDRASQPRLTVQSIETVAAPSQSTPWAFLEDNLDTPRWVYEWRVLWLELGGRSAMEALGLRWLARHHDDNISDEGSLILITLLHPNRTGVNSTVRAAALRWLHHHPVQSLRWAKVWARYVDRLPDIPAPLQELGFKYLGRIDSERKIGHNDWINVWQILERRNSSERLLDVAIGAMPTFGTRDKFAKNVLLQVFDNHPLSQSAQIIEDWFQSGPLPDGAWMEFYLASLKKKPNDYKLIRMGLEWLELTNPFFNRWAKNWVRMHDILGDEEPLIKLGVEGMREMPAHRSIHKQIIEILLRQDKIKIEHADRLRAD